MRYRVRRYPVELAGLALLRLLGAPWSLIAEVRGSDRNNTRRAVQTLLDRVYSEEWTYEDHARI
jgi:hypothetical protein